MKCKHYLSAAKILFFLHIGISVFCIGVLVVTAPRLYHTFCSEQCGFFRAISEIILRIQYQIQLLLISLTGFFIVKNFKFVYGNLKKYM